MRHIAKKEYGAGATKGALRQCAAFAWGYKGVARAHEMNSNQHPLAGMRRLFEQPGGERTQAHECQHEDCDRLALRDLCDRHRHLANADTTAVNG